MKIKLIVTVAMLLAGTVLGCSGGSRVASEHIEVTMDDVLRLSTITREVSLAVGNTLKLTLGSNHSTPYRWTADPKVGEARILKQTSHEYLQPKTDRAGAPGAEVWMFTALKPGSTSIVAEYVSVEGGDAAPVCTFTAKVTVHDDADLY